MELVESNLADMSISNLLLYVVQSVIQKEPLSDDTKIEISSYIHDRYSILRDDLGLLVERMKDTRLRGLRPFNEHRHLPTMLELAQVALQKNPLHDGLLTQVARNPEYASLVDRVREFRAGMVDVTRFDEPGLLRFMDNYRIDVSLYTRSVSRGGLILYGTKNRKSFFRLAGKPPLKILHKKVKRIVCGDPPRYDVSDGVVHDLVGIETVFEPNDRGHHTMREFNNYLVKTSPYTWAHEQEEKTGRYSAIHLDLEVLQAKGQQPSDKDNVDTVEIHLMDLNSFLEKMIGMLNAGRYASSQEVIRDLRWTKAERKAVTDKDREFVRECRSALLDVLDYTQISI